MGTELPYDHTDPKSIETYALLLLNKSLKDTVGDHVKQLYKGKGKLGQLLEDLYFRYKPNSKAEPDFEEAGVELKTTPIKKRVKGFISKERLVFNIINYLEEHKETFKTSSFWKKNSLLLLMFYLYEQDQADIDAVFKIIRLWQFPATDLRIIKEDWEKIIHKIRQGKAHEISEGDTFYLGACTKGANKRSLRKQPFSDELAMQRAFSLKSKYLNFIIEKSLAKEELEIDYNEYDIILGESIVSEASRSYRKIDFSDSEPILKHSREYGPNETFESYIIKQFTRHYGKSEEELTAEFGLNKTSAKNKFELIAKSILGVKKKKIEEFEKADVQMKTIRLEQTGTLKESMSFAQIQYKEIINEEWLDSYWYNTLTKKFFFVIFQKDKNQELRLKRVMFWTMPVSDLEVAKEFWVDTKEKILNGDFSNFIKISDKRICHVRPKGVNSSDLMETVAGNMEKKKCYWLNAGYIKKIIQE